MVTGKNIKSPHTKGIWIIDGGTFVASNHYDIGEIDAERPMKAYRISDLGRYMLAPGPVEIEKKLIGCEVHYLQTRSSRMRSRLPKVLQRVFKSKRVDPDIFISAVPKRSVRMKTEDLELHFNSIKSRLNPYDRTVKALSALDRSMVADVIGVCEDIGGHKSNLRISGTVEEKISYVINNLKEDVGVILDRAYIPEGLFEMMGFDFTSFSHERSFVLLKYFRDGRQRACVLNGSDGVEYDLEDVRMVHYLQLFEQSIRTNLQLNASLSRCLEGSAEPLKLFFKRQLGIDYSKSKVPEIYQQMFDKCKIDQGGRQAVINSLKDHQLGISFAYILRDETGDRKPFTEVSVLQNFRVLEPLKEDLPQLYSEISRHASRSETGRYYLLDSIRGSRDDK
jgi:hypothetical protein